MLSLAYKYLVIFQGRILRLIKLSVSLLWEFPFCSWVKELCSVDFTSRSQLGSYSSSQFWLYRKVMVRVKYLFLYFTYFQDNLFSRLIFWHQSFNSWILVLSILSFFVFFNPYKNKKLFLMLVCFFACINLCVLFYYYYSYYI